MPPELITSRQNNRVKAAVKLRSGRQRTKQGQFLIDGGREIGRALDAGIPCLAAFVCPALCRLAETNDALARLPQTIVSEVTPEVWEKINFGGRDDGLLVIAETPSRSLDQLELPPQPLVAVLEGLEKPGNVGAILRTADGAGLDAVIVADGHTDLFNPHTIRASLGTVFAPHICLASTAETLRQLARWQLPLVAAQPAAEQLYTDFDYRHGAAIVLGSEAQGLSAAWHDAAVVSLRLPMHGLADSLNVSATAAALFYEAVRQRSVRSQLGR